MAQSAYEFSRWVITTLERRSAETLLDVALAHDGISHEGLSRHPLAASSLDGRRGMVDIAVSFTVPIVGLVVVGVGILGRVRMALNG